jgi:hypothetical protein
MGRSLYLGVIYRSVRQNWMVADRRNGTGSYPVACFRQ